MLNRAVNGTPAKRLISSIIKARPKRFTLTLRTALAQAQRDELRADPSTDDPLSYLGLAAKVQLLEVREKVHLVVKPIAKVRQHPCAAGWRLGREPER